MSLRYTEEQLALKDSARRFLTAHSGSTEVRRVMETDAGFDADTWRRIAGELGWTAIPVPEGYGGLGLGAVELAAVMEEMGRALFCAPFLSSVCLATPALLLMGSEAQKQEHLPGLAAGTTRAALAWAERTGRIEPDEIHCVAGSDGDGFVLTGSKNLVVDGHTADLLIVAARGAGTSGIAGIRLFLVDAGAPGLTRRALPTMDTTRRLAEVRLDGVRVHRSGVLGGTGGVVWTALVRVLDLAAIALAAEQVGGADRCLDLAVDYAKVRVQFGRPIGSFQAIKHKCADMLLRVESARSAAMHAAQVAARDTGIGDPEALGSAASLARSYCSEAYLHCAAESIQIHGGIGFTWEHDAHLYFKRARSTATLLGDSASHRERIAHAIGL